MKGIILAGGKGTRLLPATLAISKHLLPVYDKPMVYYPLSTLMQAGIREILVVTAPESANAYKDLLGDGSSFGIKLSYVIQPFPGGIAQAFLLGESFIGSEPCAVILGDNVFLGKSIQRLLNASVKDSQNGHAVVWGCIARDPQRFAVLGLDHERKITSLEEKPAFPRSDRCVAGLYFYDVRATGFAKDTMPSIRGECEITDINRRYLEDGTLNAQLPERGFFWADAGTPESLADASRAVRCIQERYGLVVSSPEGIAFSMGWVNREQLYESAKRCNGSSYSSHLRRLADSDTSAPLQSAAKEETGR